MLPEPGIDCVQDRDPAYTGPDHLRTLTAAIGTTA